MHISVASTRPRGPNGPSREENTEEKFVVVSYHLIPDHSQFSVCIPQSKLDLILNRNFIKEICFSLLLHTYGLNS